MGLGYRIGQGAVALAVEGKYVWDCSVIKEGGKYYMFSSMWDGSLGFGANWLFNSKICRFVSDKAEGPFAFDGVVFERRGRKYFDGMNTHNTCIVKFGGKFYLYYMGTTYGGDIPRGNPVPDMVVNETWNRKRIGLAVADRIDGEFVRRDAPLLEPRDCSHWDCTCTTNPAVAVLPGGKTYMIYKSRREAGGTLRLGIAVADNPAGPFTRLSDDPVLDLGSDDLHVEDPFLWYDGERKKFCVIAKDDSKNGAHGITGETGGGFYAESDDCIKFTVPENATLYTRTSAPVGGEVLCNLERPWLLFEDGRPVRLYCAAGRGKSPYAFEGNTFVVSFPLIKE